MNLNDTLKDIKKELDAKDRRREEIFSAAREIRRVSTRAIREIHTDNYDAAAASLTEAKGLVASLMQSDKDFSFSQEALQEYAEAMITYALLKKEELPGPKELGIPSEAYVLGLADSIGEIRRFILDTLRKGGFEAAEIEYFLDLMDELFHGIMAFDYPNAVLPIRRKQDIARMLLEKTRGEVTLALTQAKLEKRMC
ncbi:MAG: hypothetical protein V3T58_05335 [Candidatus Hydrothermarchaeales archaeon]